MKNIPQNVSIINYKDNKVSYNLNFMKFYNTLHTDEFINMFINLIMECGDFGINVSVIKPADCKGIENVFTLLSSRIGPGNILNNVNFHIDNQELLVDVCYSVVTARGKYHREKIKETIHEIASSETFEENDI